MLLEVLGWWMGKCCWTF